MIPLSDMDRKRLGFSAITATIIGMNVLMLLKRRNPYRSRKDRRRRS